MITLSLHNSNLSVFVDFGERSSHTYMLQPLIIVMTPCVAMHFETDPPESTVQLTTQSDLSTFIKSRIKTQHDSTSTMGGIN